MMTPLPSAMVIPEISAVTPAAIENTRLALLPLMVSLSAPRPVMVRSSVMLSSVPPSAMHWPIRESANVIASGPEVPLAFSIAQRSEPSSPSPVLVTVNNVESASRCSSISMRSLRGRSENACLRQCRLDLPEDRRWLWY
jgi:hypothetical protein